MRAERNGGGGRELGLALALALSLSSLAYAQDVDSGLDAGELSDSGVIDAGEIIPDSGIAPSATPADEQPDVEVALPEGHEANIELTLAPDQVMTGDVVTATIAVTLTEGDDVAVPRQEFGTLELHAQRHTDRPLDGQRHVFVFELDFLMLAPGDQELPPIRLRVVTADGVVGTMHTQAMTIHVGSLIANEPDAQPRAASLPVPVMQDDYTLAYVLGALGLVLLGALLAWLAARWWRRQPKALPPPAPKRPAWEIALEKIETLRKRLPVSLEENRQVEIVDGVSDALREFLGARFEFNGLESTSDEVIARLRHERLGPIALEEIIALLGDADLVKFARAVPDRETCDRMIEGTVRIVRGTMTVMPSAIAKPARPAGERVSSPGGRKKKPPTTGVDDAMIAAAAKSQAAAEAALRGDGRREVPDTNPPPPAASTATETATGEAASVPASPPPESPWRESKATIADYSRDPNDPNDKDGAS